MLAGGCRASRWAAPRCGRMLVRVNGAPRCLRRYSTPPNQAAASTAQPPSALASLAGVTNELDRYAPRFEVQASQIEILKEPREFYESLKNKILNAKSRIFLATLYIGKTELELVDTIRQALRSNPNLRVSFLTDALRGTRETPEPSCASLLAPLVAEFGPERVEVRMFHTPNLTGLRKRFIPKRINEGWGLQHMKLYGVDDEIIMSGANLSTDYFTNRQDRYHVLRSKELTHYYSLVHDATCSISFLVQPTSKADPSTYTLHWPDSNSCVSPLENPKAYIAYAAKLLDPLIHPNTSSTSKAPSASTDTLIYPLFQLTPLLGPDAATDTSTELPAMTTLLSALAPTAPLHGATWTFTAGYFNMTPAIRSLLLTSKPPSATVIAASPQANGFFGSKGVSGLLPPAYTLLEGRFLQAVKAAGLAQQVRVLEWRRGTVGEEGGWTYHAKGVWVTLAGERAGEKPPTGRQGPSISLVGSSNYTARSYRLDLEANALIVTRNADLMRRLGAEEQWLQEHAREVGEDEFTRTERRVGLHVRLAMWIVGVVGGAL